MRKDRQDLNKIGNDSEHNKNHFNIHVDPFWCIQLYLERF